MILLVVSWKEKCAFNQDKLLVCYPVTRETQSLNTGERHINGRNNYGTK